MEKDSRLFETNSSFIHKGTEIHSVYMGDNLYILERHGIVTSPIFFFPTDSYSIQADLTTFDLLRFSRDCDKLFNMNGFTAIIVDAPWKLATNKPVRGPALSYTQLTDLQISSINYSCLQDNGLIFFWTIQSKLSLSLRILEENGYKLIDVLVWIKTTAKGKIAASTGYHFTRSKELCLVGKKGYLPIGSNQYLGNDLIIEMRGKQSQKPKMLYQIIEKSLNSVKYLELFGRSNNLRPNWITIGLQLPEMKQDSILSILSQRN